MPHYQLSMDQGISSTRQFDIIIFGATGYTGRYVIEELANSDQRLQVKWAVAGRNREKLKASLAAVQHYLDEKFSVMNIEIIEANVNDMASIAEMCKKTKLILNCVGPYKLYGEIVVAACIESGTHHVDISAEPKFLATMQAKYFDAAREKRVYIVQACGFGSVPADLGIGLLKEKFSGGLNSVESYVQLLEGPEGRVTNVGTWLSAVHSIRDVFYSKPYFDLLRESVFTKDFPKYNYRLTRRSPLFYSDVVKGWCLWFIEPDEGVIKRSQMFSYQFFNENPVQMNSYIRMSSLLMAFFYMFFATIFTGLSQFSMGRYLLKKFPSFFSAGFFSNRGPTRKQVEQSSLKMILCGEGWTEKLSETTDQHHVKPNKKMKLKITGPDPAYVLTSTCMVQAALVILEEGDQMPLQGGVFTPCAAFSNTSILKRLEKRGVVFKFEE